MYSVYLVLGKFVFKLLVIEYPAAVTFAIILVLYTINHFDNDVFLHVGTDDTIVCHDIQNRSVYVKNILVSVLKAPIVVAVTTATMSSYIYHVMNEID